MLRRFFEVCPPELNKKTGPKPCLILSDEIIPGELLLSRAHFRFISSLQNSNTKTIFTTCQKKQPFTVDWVKNEYAFGDYGMIKAFIVGNEFTDDALAEYENIVERRFIYGVRPSVPKMWNDVKLVSYSFNEQTNLLDFKIIAENNE